MLCDIGIVKYGVSLLKHEKGVLQLHQVDFCSIISKNGQDTYIWEEPMIITLMMPDQLTSMTLPKKANGRFWIRQFDGAGIGRKLISIEAVNDVWVLKSNHTVSVLDETGTEVKCTTVEPRCHYRLWTKSRSGSIMVIAEPLTLDRQLYQKYLVTEGAQIRIGRDEFNDICFNNGLVSSYHAVLTYNVEGWSIADQSSTNGTYVNGRRITSCSLSAGDVIFIMGLNIVVGDGFLSMNNPDHQVKAALHPFRPQQIDAIPKEDDDVNLEGETEAYFDRSPRFKRDIRRREIQIDGPPTSQEQERVPMALMLGPSLTMGIVSLAIAGVTVNNILSNGGSLANSLTSLLMSLSMMLSCVLWPVLTKRFEQKARVRKEKERQEKYTAYLQSVQKDIERECAVQTEILVENGVTTADCMERVMGQKRNLWERSAGQSDFLTLRVGIGELPLNAEIKYPERHFSLADDNLRTAMYELAELPKLLRNVPITLSLTDAYMCGITGERQEILRFVQGLILQLTALHSYDEVKLVVIASQDEYAEWEYCKWLPHIWSDDYQIRFFATETDEVKELSAYLERETIGRLEENRKDSEYAPYYVVIVADKELFAQAGVLKQILHQKKNIGFSIITLFNELKNLPKECMQIIALHGDRSYIYDKNDITDRKLAFQNDMLSSMPMRQLAVRMANIHLELEGQQTRMPDMLRFLEMYGVGKIEHLNPLTRWQENDPTKTLQVPVGVDDAGNLLMLDLHEKFHGPHGLVAGMTGSGKSEFIITYILSMAINYHPDEVAFILIDYKGGGLAGAFVDSEKEIKLPHLAGTITNLDGAAVKRSLISIQSELRHRQAVFNDARKVSNEGTMDIYKYQKLRRDGVVSEAIPHLFIISDEFAELKQQQPDFMEQLISTARIGRSLGVHLILATQKPNGVVDDQIWSNSRFRVCLKVQERADSMDMIKRPDAATLSITGRFFLQVGFNEYFREGQSAWCGAQYVPADNVTKRVDDSIRVVDHLGRTIREVKPVTDPRLTSSIREIVAIVKYLSDLAHEENISVRSLWMDAIPEFIYVDALEEKYGWIPPVHELEPVVGEYDDPFNQSQRLMTLPLTRDGNAIVYGYTGSGTEDFLSSMVYSILSHHSPEEVSLYLLDFGGETMGCFAAAPQVGDVVYSFNAEKVKNLFGMLGDEIERRKKIFSDFGGSHQSYCRTAKMPVPAIVVVINNYASFIELFDDLESKLCTLTREGSRTGIHFVLTAASSNAVRYKVAQNFKQLVVMQMNDPGDYSGILGNTEGVFPSRIKGRGVVRYDKVYEFQTAHVFEPEHELAKLGEYCEELKGRWSIRARRIPILPDIVGIDFVAPQITDLSMLPVGVAKDSLQIVSYSFQSSYISLVMGQETDDLAPVVLGLIQAAQRIRDLQVHVWDMAKVLARAENLGCAYCCQDLDSLVVDLFWEVVRRNNEYKDAGLDLSVLAPYPRNAYFLFGVKMLMDSLGEDERDKLQKLLEKGEADYKIHFILCDDESTLSVLAHQPWFARHVNSGEGIWVGDGFSGQYTMKPTKLNSGYYEEIGSNFGYVLKRGRPTLTKLLQA